MNISSYFVFGLVCYNVFRRIYVLTPVQLNIMLINYLSIKINFDSLKFWFKCIKLNITFILNDEK